MKRFCRFAGVFLSAFFFAFLVFAVNSHAEGTPILDSSKSSEGIVEVEYAAESTVKMKVGVTFKGSTVYYNYVPGTKTAYSLTNGDGQYTVTLYKNIYGTSYKTVARSTFTATIADTLAPYRASTAEITFSKDDGIGMKAAELCAGKTTDAEKIVAIHNFIAANFSYDYDLAAKIAGGLVKNYVPNTNEVLMARKGICYGISAVFAAMCRSQGIPCVIQKGNYRGEYHAWNSVYVNGEWQAVDLTVSIGRMNTAAEKIEDIAFVCCAENGYTA